MVLTTKAANVTNQNVRNHTVNVSKEESNARISVSVKDAQMASVTIIVPTGCRMAKLNLK